MLLGRERFPNLKRSIPFILATILTAAQTPAPDTAISYEASVKLNNSPETRPLTEYHPGGRFTAIAVQPRTLLRMAYRVQDHQIVGAPDWFSAKRYDIAAKAENTPPPTQQDLLHALLTDHFKLAVHKETREMARFALVLARADGRLGPQLSKTDFDCAAYAATPHGPPDPSKTPACGARSNPWMLSGKAMLLSQLINALTSPAGRFIVDRTGLEGRFDIELNWTPDPPVMLNGSIKENGPALFTALREQLGLKLVSEKGPVEVLVVDRAEEPARN